MEPYTNGLYDFLYLCKSLYHKKIDKSDWRNKYNAIAVGRKKRALPAMVVEKVSWRGGLWAVMIFVKWIGFL